MLKDKRVCESGIILGVTNKNKVREDNDDKAGNVVVVLKRIIKTGG
jgi:hypothetical protein